MIINECNQLYVKLKLVFGTFGIYKFNTNLYGKKDVEESHIDIWDSGMNKFMGYGIN